MDGASKTRVEATGAGARGQRRRTALPLVAIAAVAALVFAVTGCGTSTVDQDDEVALINKQLDDQGLKADSVECPDDVEAKEGETFECDVTLTNGNTGTYDVKVEKVDDDSASLQITGAHDTGAPDKTTK